MRDVCRIVLIFIIAFALNAVWELWHAQFYMHYQGGAITALILLRAAMADAAIITITILAAVIAQSYFFDTKIDTPGVSIFAIPAWLIIAVLLEQWALSSNRWAYNDTMLIIPFVQTGLTPTIQLALLGTASWYIVRSFILCKHKKTR